MQCRHLCVYWCRLSCKLSTSLRKLQCAVLSPTKNPKRRKVPVRDSRVESCSVMCFVASVGTGGDSVRSGCGFWRGSCSGSANAVGALGSRSRQLLPACVPRHVARLTARRPCCSLRQVSTAQLPLNLARLRGVRRHALPPAQLTSAQLSCLRLSLAHLSSAHLRLGPSAGRPHSVSPLALNLQPNPSRCLQLVWSARACGPRAARPAAGRMGRAERCSQPVRLSPLAPRSGPKLNSSTCEPPVIDL